MNDVAVLLANVCKQSFNSCSYLHLFLLVPCELGYFFFLCMRACVCDYFVSHLSLNSM